MPAHQSYEEQLADFIIDQALPHDVIPLIYVLEPHKDPLEPYIYKGIHLVETNEMLRTPFLREPNRTHIKHFYTRNLESVNKYREDIVLYLESVEWTSFLEDIYHNEEETLLETILFNTIIHQDDSFNSIKSYLIHYQQTSSEESLKKADNIIVDFRRQFI